MSEPLTLIDIVFDGPPSRKSGRFVEVENQLGQSIKYGDWVKRDDGYWALRIQGRDATMEEVEKQLADAIVIAGAYRGELLRLGCDKQVFEIERSADERNRWNGNG